MSLPTQPYKGTRDFYPEDKRLQDYMFTKIREVVRRFGYLEYDTPLIEPLELYRAKSGEEIVSEQTYSFTDRGGREVAIRPEMTPSVSRLVAARRQQLAYPLRWFSIPNLWRYERPQRGRLREHWQLNVDIFGVASHYAELELIMVADALLRSLGADESMFKIKVNHRSLLDHLFSELNLNAAQAQKLAKVIDRKDKLERVKFIEQVDALLEPAQRESGATEQLLKTLSIKSLAKLPQKIKDSPEATELGLLMADCNQNGINNIEFDLSVVRGFDYYNGIVFELYDTSPDNSRSMLGGGRYDGLVGLFGVDPVATAGFGLGDATLLNFLSIHHLLPDLVSEVDLAVAVVGEQMPAALAVAEKLRSNGLNVAIDFSGRKLGEQIKSANKAGVPQVLIVGELEANSGIYTLRDLAKSSEAKLSIEQIIKKYKPAS